MEQDQEEVKKLLIQELYKPQLLSEQVIIIMVDLEILKRETMLFTKLEVEEICLMISNIQQ